MHINLGLQVMVCILVGSQWFPHTLHTTPPVQMQRAILIKVCRSIAMAGSAMDSSFPTGDQYQCMDYMLLDG
jgi:hypothetical protein